MTLGSCGTWNVDKKDTVKAKLKMAARKNQNINATMNMNNTQQQQQQQYLPEWDYNSYNSNYQMFQPPSHGSHPPPNHGAKLPPGYGPQPPPSHGPHPPPDGSNPYWDHSYYYQPDPYYNVHQHHQPPLLTICHTDRPPSPSLSHAARTAAAAAAAGGISGRRSNNAVHVLGNGPIRVAIGGSPPSHPSCAKSTNNFSSSSSPSNSVPESSSNTHQDNKGGIFRTKSVKTDETATALLSLRTPNSSWDADQNFFSTSNDYNNAGDSSSPQQTYKPNQFRMAGKILEPTVPALSSSHSGDLEGGEKIFKECLSPPQVERSSARSDVGGDSISLFSPGQFLEDPRRTGSPSSSPHPSSYHRSPRSNGTGPPSDVAGFEMSPGSLFRNSPHASFDANTLTPMFSFFNPSFDEDSSVGGESSHNKTFEEGSKLCLSFEHDNARYGEGDSLEKSGQEKQIYHHPAKAPIVMRGGGSLLPRPQKRMEQWQQQDQQKQKQQKQEQEQEKQQQQQEIQQQQQEKQEKRQHQKKQQPLQQPKQQPQQQHTLTILDVRLPESPSKEMAVPPFYKILFWFREALEELEFLLPAVRFALGRSPIKDYTVSFYV
uniref:Uncharacterized protein n=1 Tax=Corethron hystrix TaxID=216773 RepID=A0A7S1BNN5_9STRA